MTDNKNLDPAYSIAMKFGGFRPLARILGISPSAVLRWSLPADKRGSGGAIPQRHWQSIIHHAKLNKLKVSLHDLSNIR
jgi:hypothetical protein